MEDVQERTLEQDLKGGPDQDTCPACGCQLAVHRGPVMIEELPDEFKREGSPRDIRQSFVGCGTCGRPVAIDHPKQVKLDKDWKELEAKEAAEKKRAANAPRPKIEANEQLHPTEVNADEHDLMRKQITDLQKRIAALEGEKAPRKK